MSVECLESQTILRLREQLHKSFLQINQMEKLFHLEINHVKEEIEEREKVLEQREEELRKKYENKKKGEEKAKIDDFQGLEISIDSIPYRRCQSLQDSVRVLITKGIFRIKQLLCQHQIDPEYQFKKLEQLRSKILDIVTCPPSVLFQLFELSHELCLDNCRLKQQLLNYQQTNEVFRNKIQQLQEELSIVKHSELTLKNQNQQLNQLYSKQHIVFQQEIGYLRTQINSKNDQISQLKTTQLKIKSSPRIDILKLNRYSHTKSVFNELPIQPPLPKLFMAKNKSYKENKTSVSPSVQKISFITSRKQTQIFQ